MDPTDDPIDDLPDVAPAPPRPAQKSLMCAKDLCFELAMGALDLSFQGLGIHTQALKACRPVLAETYTQRFSTIPSYLGRGRSNDGLFLYRGKKSKDYSPSFENATRAFKWLKDNGYDMDDVAEELGFGLLGELVTAIKQLPPHKG